METKKLTENGISTTKGLGEEKYTTNMTTDT